jgi:nucleoside-diphosphate-sugar epimerase
MADLAELVIGVLGKGRIVFRDATEQTFSLFTSIDRARDVLGYQPQIDTRQIIERLLRR